MGAPIHPAVKKRAKELYEVEGYSPQQIVDTLPLVLAKGTFMVPAVDIDEVRLPEHRSDINNWAKQEGWTPHWREAKRKVNQRIEQDIAAGMPFAISGISDPIWHLAILEAQRYVADLKPPLPPFLASLLRKGYSRKQIEEAALTNQPLDFSVEDDFDPAQTFLHKGSYDLGSDDEELIAATAVHVNQVLRPGPRVLLRLRPIIQHELKKARETYRWLETFTPDSDNPPFPFDVSDLVAEWSRNPSEVWEERLKDRGHKKRSRDLARKESNPAVAYIRVSTAE